MAESLSFTTASRKAKPINFVLDGEKFTFTPPKQADVFLEMIEDNANVVALTKKTFDWLSDGLPEEQSARIIARLKDPEDDFDLPNLKQLLETLQEKVSGGPTT